MHAFAIPNTLDLGRISHLLDNVTSSACLSDMLGVVKVNIDLCPHDGMQHLVRCHKDAEVVAACLVLYWHKETGCLEAILVALSDLVFDARSMGTLSSFKIEKFKMAEKEDADREVMGMSSYRKCLFLVDLASDVSAENVFPDVTDEAQKLVRALGSAKGVLSTWNVDTMKRYLAVGRKLKTASIQTLIERWEFTEKREALIDGINMLRAVCAHSLSDVELLLHTMFLEQRANLRTAKSAKSHGHSLAHMTKGLLIRARFYKHLALSYPEFAGDLTQFVDLTCFKTYFGIDAYGRIDAGFKRDDGSDDGGDDADWDPAEMEQAGEVSSYKSRPMLLSLAKKMLECKYERTFVAMAKEQSQSNLVDSNVLNLTLKASLPLKKVLAHIDAAYKSDFPPAPAKSTTMLEHTPTKQMMSAGGSAAEPLLVALEQCCADETEYNEKIGLWNQRVTHHEEECVKSFINARIQWVIDSGLDPTKQAEKVNNCSLARERTKRKAFYLDLLTYGAVDHEKCKKQKKSVFSSTDAVSLETQPDHLIEIYSKCRSVDDDGASDDLLMFALQGPPPDEPENKPVASLVKKLKAMVPKHQKAKIGTIDTIQTDVLRRFKYKSFFNGKSQDFVVFTQEKKTNMARNTMAYLEGGNAYFNKWPVHAIPFENMRKVSLEKYRQIVGELAADTPLEMNMEEALDATPHELSLKDDEVIAFPKEIAYEFAREVINVFAIDTFVALHGASGESMKAVLLSNTRGICVTLNQQHKAFILANLVDFVKMHHLVTIPKNGIPKPDECIAWEKQQATTTKLATKADPPQPGVLRGATSAAPVTSPTPKVDKVDANMPPENASVVASGSGQPKVTLNPATAMLKFGAGKL